MGYLYIVFIIIGSLMSLNNFDPIPYEHGDKWIHFILYFVLVSWFIQIYQQWSSQFLVLVLSIVLGMTLEVLQGMTGYRSFDYYDALSNSMGAASAFMLIKTPYSRLLYQLDRILQKKLSSN